MKESDCVVGTFVKLNDEGANWLNECDARRWAGIKRNEPLVIIEVSKRRGKRTVLHAMTANGAVVFIFYRTHLDRIECPADALDRLVGWEAERP